MELNELTTKVKKAFITELLKNEHLLDEPYLTTKTYGAKRWTRREIAREVQNETEFGIKQLTKILNLSLDLLTRNIGKELMRDENIEELLK